MTVSYISTTSFSYFNTIILSPPSITHWDTSPQQVPLPPSSLICMWPSQISWISITWLSLRWEAMHCRETILSKARALTKKCQALPQQPLTASSPSGRGVASWAPLLLMMNVDWSSHIRVYADIHSCNEFIYAMAVSCAEDFFSAAFLPILWLLHSLHPLFSNVLSD